MRIRWAKSNFELPEDVHEAVSELISKLPAEIDLGEAIFIVGSSLVSNSPGDVDILISTKRLDEFVDLLQELPREADIPLHPFVSSSLPHGYHIPVYRLKLVRDDDAEIKSPSEYVEAGKVLRAVSELVTGLPDSFEALFPCSVEPALSGRRIQIQKWFDRVLILDYHTGESLPELDVVKLEVWKMDSPQIGIWDAILQESGHVVLLDVLLWEGTPAYRLPLLARRTFLLKTELADHLSLAPTEIAVDFEDLFEQIERRGLDLAIVKPLFSDANIAFLITEAEKRKVVAPGVPLTPLKVGSGYHKEEWFGPEDVWKFWLKPMLDRGKTVVAEEKYDGFRLIVEKDGDRVWLFTEDAKRDRSKILPGLVEAVKKLKCRSCILDCECMAFENDEPVPRIDLAPLWGGNKPITDLDIRVFVFDLLYLDGKDLHELPFRARRKALEKLLRNAPKEIILAKQSQPIKSLAQLKKVWEEFSKAPGSEGIMLKTLEDPYELDGSTQFWAKCKLLREADYLIIGYRKVPEDKPAGEHWTREEALKKLPQLLAKSKTYIMRAAILHEGKLIPVESKHKLTERDVQLDWDEKKQKWVGLDDPKLWKMFKGFEHREPGELAYANTYAISLDEPPHSGDVVTVAASEIDIWKEGEDWHISWQHPRVRTIKRGKGKPDTLSFLKRFARIRESLEPEETAAIYEAKSPGAEGGEGSEGQDTHKVRYAPGKGKKLPFVIQYHARGFLGPEEVTELRRKLRAGKLTREDWKRLGLRYLEKPIDEIRKELRNWLESKGRLAETDLPVDWIDDQEYRSLLEAAENAAAKAKQYLSEEYVEDAPPERVVQVGNCHIDLRFMDPNGDFLRGWTMITSPIAWQALSGDVYYPVPDYLFEGKPGTVHWICAAKLYQPLPWLTLVSKDSDWWAPPGSPGSTERTWGHFRYVDSGYLYLGTQKDDYHEYFIVFKEHRERSGTLNIAKIPSREDYERLGQSGEWWWTGFINDNPPYILRHNKQSKEKQAKAEGLTYIYWNPEGALLAFRDRILRGKIFEGVDEEKLERAIEQYSANRGVWTP